MIIMIFTLNFLANFLKAAKLIILIFSNLEEIELIFELILSLHFRDFKDFFFFIKDIF